MESNFGPEGGKGKKRSDAKVESEREWENNPNDRVNNRKEKGRRNGSLFTNNMVFCKFRALRNPKVHIMLKIPRLD
jgi:hypothetical protein